jgi:murein DD-endopeptidase MepM/ murein hydrolase activator NlpD
MSRATRPRRPGGRIGGTLLALFIATMVLVPGVRPTAADELSTKQNQRQQLKGLMDNLHQQIQEAADQEARLNAAIATLDGQITQTEQTINDAQAKLDQIGTDLANAQAQLAQTRAKLATDKKQLAEQLVLIYEQGNTNTLNRVLGSSSFNEFWQKLLDLRRLAGSQQSMLRSVQHEEAEVNTLVAQVSGEQAQQKQLLGSLHTQADNLNTELGARQAAVAWLQQVQAQDAQRLADAEKAAKELDAEIAAIKAAMAAAAMRGGGNGHFVWPEQGPITQGFGCTTYPFEPWDPNCATHHFHSGIDIGAAWGTPVGAGDAGIAYTYVSSYGYGNHVIIVHGNGWVSIYGHLAQFAVGNGQGVGRGQVIGYEGSTGNSTGPHLHFEIRLNDTPQNPLQYLP